MTAAPRNPSPAQDRDPAEESHPGATTDSRSAIIEARGLNKTFDLKDTVQQVLTDVDLDIMEGDFTVIMGPSGAGKSTLMYSLSGMDQPSSGLIMFADRQISGLSPDQLARFRRSHSGFVFQQIYLLDWLSVMDNVLAVGVLNGDPTNEVRDRANQLFSVVGIDEASRTKMPSMLSGGEAQRVALVRALISSPDVLFADEPTGQLNSQSSQLVLDLVTLVNGRGQSVVMVTHDVRSAMRGNRVLYLRDGAIRGELRLPVWTEDSDDRRTRLTSFLTGLGW